MSRHILAKICAAIFWLSIVLFGGCYFIPVPQAAPTTTAKLRLDDLNRFIVDIDGAVHHLRELPTDVARDVVRDWAVYGTLMHLHLPPEAIARAIGSLLPARSLTLAPDLPIAHGPGRLAIIGNDDDTVALVFIDEDDPDPRSTVATLLDKGPSETNGKPQSVHVLRLSPNITAAEIHIEQIPSPATSNDKTHAGLDAESASTFEYAAASLRHTLTSHPAVFLSAAKPKRGKGNRSGTDSTPDTPDAPDAPRKSSSDASPNSSPHPNSPPATYSIPSNNLRSAPWKEWSRPEHPRHAKPAKTKLKGAATAGHSHSGTDSSAEIEIEQSTAQRTTITKIDPDGGKDVLSGMKTKPDRVNIELQRERAPKNHDSPSKVGSLARPDVTEPPRPELNDAAARRTLEAIDSGDAQGALAAMGQPSVKRANALHDLALDDANAHLKRGNGAAAGSLYDLAADIEGHSSPDLQLRHALADIQRGRPQRGLSQMSDPSNLSPEAAKLIETTPELGDLPDYVAARKNPTQTILGVPASELELVADGTELRSALKLQALPKGESISMAERAKLATAPGNTVFYIDDGISLNRHDLEMGGQGKLAEVAKSPDVSWEAVAAAGERHMPGMLVDKTSGARERRIAVSYTGPAPDANTTRIHIRFRKPHNRCDTDHNGVISDVERRACPVAGAPK